MKNKASKRDIEASNKRVLNDDKNHRFESYDGEFDFENYIKINNTNLPAEEVAKIIKEKFYEVLSKYFMKDYLVWAELKNELKNEIQKIITKVTQYRPVVVTAVVDVEK